MLRRVPLVLALVAVVLLAFLLALRWGKPRVVARVEGDVVAPPTGDSGVLAWVEQRGASAFLLVGKGSKPRPVALARGSGAAGAYSTAILSNGIRVSVPASSGTAGHGALALAARALTGDTRLVCWLTSVGAAVPAAPFVAAGGPASAILAFPDSRAEKPTPLYASLSTGGIELIGVDRGSVYWLERDSRAGESVTTIRRRPVTGGDAETVVEEHGRQSAVLFRGRLVWTAPSLENSNGSPSGAVKSRQLPGGETQVVADWLGPNAQVAAGDDAVYVLDNDGTWRLGDRRGEQRFVYEGYYGSPTRAVVGAYEYLLRSDRGSKTLVKRGLTWGAKLRSALGI